MPHEVKKNKKTLREELRRIGGEIPGTVKADDPGEVDVDDIRAQVAKLASEDDQFKGDGEMGCPPYVCSLGLTPDGQWRARISVGGNSAKVTEVDVEMGEDGDVTALSNPREVERRTVWVPAKGEAVFNFVMAGDVEGHPFRGNQHTTQGASMTVEAKRLSGDAEDKSIAAQKSLKESDIRAAADAHRTAAKAHYSAAMHYQRQGDEEMVKHHLDKEMYHGGQAYEHLKEAGKAKASSPIIHCRDCGVPILKATKWEQGVPIRTMWMPGGVNTITATVSLDNGENRPIRFCVSCDESTAERVQGKFARILAENPNRPPFGCVEHQERERATSPKKFEWVGDEGKSGVWMTHEPSSLGAANVNGNIHSSWSPSFSTDADFSKLVKAEDGVWTFKDGERGSESNPAEVTGPSPKSVGSLTNWNAFKTILPVTVTAREGEVKAGAPMGNQNAAGPHEMGSSAWGKSSEANTASKKAIETGSDDDHRTASEEHARAQFRHLKAAEEADANKDKEGSEYHKAQAALHGKAASMHQAKYMGSKQSKASEPHGVQGALLRAVLIETKTETKSPIRLKHQDALGRLARQVTPAT